MSEQKAQAFWAPGGATLRLPPRMRLAHTERERLWKGLERFANCGDDLADFEALSLFGTEASGQQFSDFWPVNIWHYPNQEGFHPPVLGTISAAVKRELSEREIKQTEWESKSESLNWHPTCHKLFLFYRDTLREIWHGRSKTIGSADDRPMLADLNPTHAGWIAGHPHEFLLGLTDYNEEARAVARKAKSSVFSLTRPYALDCAWRDILDKFPTAAVEGRVEISMLWGIGDFFLVPHNNFQRAFYLLFRQNWRARVCPRCKMFFVARKPKQIFCGTACSAGNRLVSKRKWWNRVGVKRRAKQRQRISKSRRKERKNR